MRKPKPLPPIELLREFIAYNPDTGELAWLKRQPRHFATAAQCATWNTRYAGKRAVSCIGRDGYARGYVAGVMCLGHRVAYAIHHGFDPEYEIDHISGVRSDNRIANLRRSDPLTNNRNRAAPNNNTSGEVGVDCLRGRWRASITVNNKSKHLGYFDTFEEALEARKTAEREYGFHENHGRSITGSAAA